MEDIAWCITSGLMSGMSVSGNNFSITKYVWRHWWHSWSLGDIKNDSCQSFFQPICGFAGAWMAIRGRNASPWGCAALNRKSTCHGPRPGPRRAHGVRAGSLRATEPRARKKHVAEREIKCRRAKKTHLYVYVYTLRMYYHVWYVSKTTTLQQRRCM